MSFTQQDIEIVSTGFIDTSIPTAPKRIIICCDGTWQSSVSGLKNIPSNITRLARSIARVGKDQQGKVWQQIVYYDAGIGTGDLSNAEKDRQGGFGIGFLGNVIEAYSFIASNYAPGDQILCFGFSRGAYTARAVAGLVNDIGVISPRDLQDFPDLYKLYQAHKDSQGFRKSKAYRDWIEGVPAADQPPKVLGGFQEPKRWKQPPHRPVTEASRTVEVVGVFDTVGSLGIPDLTWTQYNLKFLERFAGIPEVGFHNVSLSPYIRRAFHALALDEHRGPFSPTLWHFPAEADRSPSKPAKSREDLRMAWYKISEDETAEEKDKSAAWSALVDCESYEHLQGIDSDLLQVWFPGVHINIGGGSDDMLKDALEGDFEQISLVTFAWMCEQVAPYLQFDGDLMSLAQSSVSDRFNLITPILKKISEGVKDYGGNWVTSKGWQLLDKAGLKKAGLKTIPLGAVNGWATGPIVDSFTGTMTAAGSIIRTPGAYGAGAVEMIHPSIKYRMMKNTTYRPEALKNFERSLRKTGDKVYEWKRGNITIPEYIIKDTDYFTRHVAGQDAGTEDHASDFIGRLDRDLGQKSNEREFLETREESIKRRKMKD